MKKYRASEVPKSPVEIERERIDAEPVPTRCPQISVGRAVWYIDANARWFLLEVVARQGLRVTFKPVTGRDSEREVDWPHGDLLEIPRISHLAFRLRPLSARRP